MNITKHIVLLLIVFFCLASCQKEEQNQNDDKGKGDLYLSFSNTVGDEGLVYYKSYEDSSGRKYNISTSRYYISNIRLIKDDMSEVAFDRYLLVKPEQNSVFKIDSLEPGNYRGIRFNIGLDSMVNHLNPSDYLDGHPLALQNDVSMHWGLPSAGYIFLLLEGQVDSSETLNGVIDFNWEMEIGSDDLLRNLEFLRDFQVLPGVDVRINLVCDHEKLLDNVNFRFENQTHTFDNFLLALKIAENFSKAFYLASSD